MIYLFGYKNQETVHGSRGNVDSCPKALSIEAESRSATITAVVGLVLIGLLALAVSACGFVGALFTGGIFASVMGAAVIALGLLSFAFTAISLFRLVKTSPFLCGTKVSPDVKLTTFPAHPVAVAKVESARELTEAEKQLLGCIEGEPFGL